MLELLGVNLALQLPHEDEVQEPQADFVLPSLKTSKNPIIL